MNQCTGCGKEVAEEVCSVPRLPCPFCGATGRSFSREVHANIAVTASISWSQTRPAQNGSATLNDTNQINLNLAGRPPRNEEGALAIAARLVRMLNASGANWSDPLPGSADADAVSTDRTDPIKTLSMQVVRATTDETLWQTLGREGVAEKRHDVVSAASELITSIRKKAGKYPIVQRSVMTLVLDAGRTPNHTFQQVHDLFVQAHRDECRDFGFSSVWVVGAVDALVTRLDQ